jgi:hypothetical protein
LKYEITGVDFNLYSEKNSIQFLKELEKRILISIKEHENFTTETSYNYKIQRLVNKIQQGEEIATWWNSFYLKQKRKKKEKKVKKNENRKSK